MTFTFDPRSPNSGFEPVRKATILRKPRPNRFICSAGILFTRSAGHIDRQTHTQTNCSENITPPRFCGGVTKQKNKQTNWYDMRGCNSLRDLTTCLFFVTVDLYLGPSASIKVTFTLFIWYTLCYCVLVTSMKYKGSIRFEIWTIFRENLNDVPRTSSPIRLSWNSNTNLPRAYLIDMPNFI